MKKVITFIALLAGLSAQAQDRKVAVFDPAGNAENHVKDIVREEISAVIVNTVGYTVLERQLIDRVLAENQFQAGGLVDDAQISEMGRMMGANIALVTTVTPMVSNFHISCKLIDVQTARIDKQQTARTQNGMNDLMDVVKKMVREMLGQAREMPGQSATPAPTLLPVPAPGLTASHPAEPEMVFVQGGTFLMGCLSEKRGDCFPNERPAHIVTVSSFHIGKYEVTQGQWKALMGNNPSHFRKGDNYPVENVSWNEIQLFISYLNAATGKQYRLPTEAEWEWAARGGENSQGYKYSGGNFLNTVGWYSGNSNKTTHPAGIKTPNELGIYDMSGNVREWCNDWYGSYPSPRQLASSPRVDPVGPSSGSGRVVRGDGFSTTETYSRISYRYYNSQKFRAKDLGFRLVHPSQ